MPEILEINCITMCNPETGKTQTLLESKVKDQTPMKASMKAMKFHSQPLSSISIASTSMDAYCFSIDKETFSGPVLCDCNTHSSERANVEPIEPEDYRLFTTQPARIKTNLQKKLPLPLKNLQADNNQSELEDSIPAAGRYFDALEGPELEVLRGSEQLLIPPNKKWPFLLRFPISCFAIPMGLGSQTILWKNLALSPAMNFLHIPKSVNLILWCLALVALAIIFTTYAMKCIFYFEAVRREYYHPVRINYFFAPWIACMFLLLGLPPSIAISNIQYSAWCTAFILPLLLLELKIYGQWLSGNERRLSKVANPSTHMAVVGNFVGAQLGESVGWKEFATAFWAIGLVHYLVVFVTLYQRLPTNETLPKELHPVFFLFIAAPSAASVAWEMIVGDFDFVSRIAYFLAIFLLSSLVVRLNFFRGTRLKMRTLGAMHDRFSISWWAYIFPTTAASVAAIHYSQKVTTLITQGLAAALSFLSAAMLISLFLITCHTCMWGNFFPNDLAIAITRKRRKLKPKSMRKESRKD